MRDFCRRNNRLPVLQRGAEVSLHWCRKPLKFAVIVGRCRAFNTGRIKTSQQFLGLSSPDRRAIDLETNGGDCQKCGGKSYPFEPRHRASPDWQPAPSHWNTNHRARQFRQELGWVNSQRGSEESVSSLLD
jgi:hypothetical protein